MNTYSEKLLEAKVILGSFAKVGKLCNVSGKAVMKWAIAGRPPRTEYTGETNYAELISIATCGKVSKADLIPILKIDEIKQVASHKRRSTDQHINND